MARHRWATGASGSGRQRLERIFDAGEAAALSAAGAEFLQPDGGGDPEGTIPEPFAGRVGTGSRGPRRRWVATRRAALAAAGFALAIGVWLFLGTDRGTDTVIPVAPPAPEAAKDASSPVRDNAAGHEGAAGQGAAGQEGAAGHDNAAVREESPRSAGGGTVVVHVAGAVRAPGVVEITAGSRVFEVLEKAGGALPEAELTAVNLAAEVQDGQQILIPAAGGSPGQAAAPAPAAPAEPPLVNLNTADSSELETLPRVGPVLAERIVEWRTQHGPFPTPEDLDAVPGIGPAMLEALLPLVTV